MTKSLLNFNKSILVFIFTLILGSGTSFAFDCASYGSQVEEPQFRDAILYVMCPLQGAINIGLYVVGAVLIILILYGAIKAVTAVGDPKQLEGAKMTWSYAFFGFLVIIFAVTIIVILAKLFGIESPLNLSNFLGDSLTQLYVDLGL